MTNASGVDRLDSGYRHWRYAESFSGVGTPRPLPKSDGWIIERRIPGSLLNDGMGCYPLFSCARWTSLPDDLEALSESLVSLTIVTDPFGDFHERDLRDWFDVVRPWKRHYVLDLDRFSTSMMSRSHRRNVAAAVQSVEVIQCPRPDHELDSWCALYSELAERHGITGLRLFSRAAFERQWTVPGLVMFKALNNGHTVGLNTWYVQDDVAYGHLGATTARGYELMASYALHAFAIEYFATRVRWIDLGGAAGADGDRTGGLARFKAGWATETRQVYLCGRVLQPAVYSTLPATGTLCFPAYRFAEFADTGVETS